MKLAGIQVRGTLVRKLDSWTFQTVERRAFPIEYTGQEIDLAGASGKPFILHGRYFAGKIIADRLEAV